MLPPTPEQLETWIGHQAIDKDDKSVGKIADVYIDDRTGKAEWIAVHTGLFGTRISFVPLAGAVQTESSVKVAHDKSTIKDSPNIDPDGHLSIEEEARLYRHYGLRYNDESGSISVGEDITPEVARRRLRRRDEAAIDFIDLDEESIAQDRRNVDTQS